MSHDGVPAPLMVAPRARLYVSLVLALGILAAPGCTERNRDWCDGPEDLSCKGQCVDNVCDTSVARASGGAGGGKGGSGGRGGNAGTGGTPAVNPGMDMDALGPSDGPVSDTPVETADAGCTDDKQCTEEGKRACVNGACVACRVDQPGTMSPFCPATTAPFCQENKCVRCNDLLPSLAMQACPTGTRCNMTTGLCSECVSSADCTGDPAKPICGADYKCGKCTQAAECAAKDKTSPACLVPDGRCVPCVASADCTNPASPICVANKCVSCTTDKQCAERGGGPGLCLTDPDGKDGRCATEDETIHIGMTSCSDATSKGMMGAPFCTLQKAVTAITATRRVMVLHGPNSYAPVLFDKANGNTPVHLIGVDQPAIAPGLAEAGISLTQGLDLRVRGLTIRNGEQFGAKVMGSGTLRVNRCIFENNRTGGLLANGGAGFDVSNCVFVGNGGGMGGVGAARLGAPTGGRMGRFRTSTLIDNINGAVTCDGGQPLVGLLLRGTNSFSGCVTSELCLDDPMFSPSNPYHLGETSPARNKVSTGNAPWDDIDGDLRADPSNLTDCGADDFRKP